MGNVHRFKLLTVAVIAGLLAACGGDDTPDFEAAERAKIDVCALVAPEQLGKLYNQPLLPNPNGEGCYWNKKAGGMAYMDIRVRDTDQELRDFFNADIPSHVSLEEISDLGDGGLMTVTEGSLGVVVIEKDGRFLQSAVTFLDIDPGTEKQAELWKVYSAVLDAM